MRYMTIRRCATIFVFDMELAVKAPRCQDACFYRVRPQPQLYHSFLTSHFQPLILHGIARANNSYPEPSLVIYPLGWALVIVHRIHPKVLEPEVFQKASRKNILMGSASHHGPNSCHYLLEEARSVSEPYSYLVEADSTLHIDLRLALFKLLESLTTFQSQGGSFIEFQEVFCSLTGGLSECLGNLKYRSQNYACITASKGVEAGYSHSQNNSWAEYIRRQLLDATQVVGILNEAFNVLVDAKLDVCWSALISLLVLDSVLGRGQKSRCSLLKAITNSTEDLLLCHCA